MIHNNVSFPFQLLVSREDGGASNGCGVQPGQAGGRLVPAFAFVGPYDPFRLFNHIIHIILVLREDGGASNGGGVHPGQAGGRLVPACRQVLQVFFMTASSSTSQMAFNTSRMPSTPGRSSKMIQIASKIKFLCGASFKSLATKMGPLDIISQVANISSKYLRLLAMAQGALARQVTSAMTMMMMMLLWGGYSNLGWQLVLS